jgi:enoyl-CoA hydratase
MSEPEVLVESSSGVGRIRLNRPRAINAINLAMMRQVSDALAAFAVDDSVELVELTGVGDRGLCAGADVRELRERALSGGDVAEFFTTEYALNLTIAEYPKPYRAIMTGITMGGGMGLSVHGSDRVVDASTVLAMPETQIGLFPDVFVSFLLARMPGEIGTHMALTGASVNAADAIRLGLADRCAGPLPAPDPVLAAEWIAECYSSDDPEEIVARLADHADPNARAAAAEIERRSPVAVAVSLEALRRSARFTALVDQYEQELSLAVRMSTGAEFAEGVRAQLVDRDRNPKWSHASLSEVSRAEVLNYFEPLA